MNRVFVDVPAGFPWNPNGYQYVWDGLKDSPQVIKRDSQAKECFFICNSAAKISKGDLHLLVLEDWDNDIQLALRTGLKILPEKEEEKIWEYISKHRMRDLGFLLERFR